MYCRRCHYNLFGLPENRCPECGTPFDLGDPTSFLKTKPTSVRRLLLQARELIGTPHGFLTACFLPLMFTSFLIHVPLNTPRPSLILRAATLRSVTQYWRIELVRNPRLAGLDTKAAK